MQLPVSVETHCGAALHPHGDWHWELAPWLPGEADFAQRPTLARLEAMCRQLAVLHKETADLTTPDVPLAVQRHLQAFTALQSGIDAGRFAGLDPSALPVPPPAGMTWSVAVGQAAEVATRQLAAVQAVRLNGQWTWGDAWHNNFLLVGDEVTGLVDFATVRVDTPMADLARLLGSTTAENAEWWPVGVAAYADVQMLSEADLQAAGALSASGTVLSLANWLEWLGVERRRFASPQALCDRMSHFVLRLTHLLRGPKGP